MSLHRSTTLRNGSKSNHSITLTQERFCAPPGSSESTTLQRGASMTIQATAFSDRGYPSRPSTIIVSVDVDGVKPLKLTPEYFITYSDITFTFDETKRELEVHPIKPGGIIGEIARIRFSCQLT
ncbi:hypothetical protein AB3S75_016433 [Citrus x aurantiifolia]